LTLVFFDPLGEKIEKIGIFKGKLSNPRWLPRPNLIQATKN